MKKFFVSVIAASMMLIGVEASAQSWIAEGGFMSFNLVGENSDLLNNESLPGFYFGVNYDYSFSTLDGLTVEPGAFFCHFGKEYSPLGLEKSFHANYLRVPVNLKYQIPSETDFALTAFTGPRFNFGLGGNMFSKGQHHPGIKAFDAQWGIGFQAAFQDAVSLRVGYDFGLTKDIKDNSGVGFDKLKVYRNSVFFGFGFAF